MKIRTIDQLLDRISEDRVWRIREIATLTAQCFTTKKSVEISRVFRRSFVPIAYAHWEGFVKKAASSYIEFVSMQGLRISELSSSFLAVCLWKECAKELSKGKRSSLISVCDAIISRGNEVASIPYKDVIETSNLDSKALREICTILSLPYGPFETKELFIDAALLGKRNYIAHGEQQDIDNVEIETIKSEVVSLIESFRNEVENAAVTEAFRRR